MKTTNRAGLNACLCAGILILSAARLHAGAVTRSAKPARVPAGPSQPRIAVRGGDIVLKVPDFQAARSRVLRLAKQYRAELRDWDSGGEAGSVRQDHPIKNINYGI